jgi:hypothetical protein
VAQVHPYTTSANPVGREDRWDDEIRARVEAVAWRACLARLRPHDPDAGTAHRQARAERARSASDSAPGSGTDHYPDP